MFQLIILLAVVFGALWYGETHGLINPGGVIPDLRNVHLPEMGNGHFKLTDI